MSLFKDTAKEVAGAVGPIILTVLLLHLTVTPLGEVLGRFLVGALFVFVGLLFFLVGIRLGILPLGERIGALLPLKGSVPLIMILLFVLATVATLADPDVQVLAQQATRVNFAGSSVVWTVSLGVGVFTALSMSRVFLNVPLAWMLIGGFAAVFILSAFVPSEFVPISWDAGGITTGPLTVPFIMALSVGVVSVLGTKDRLAASFGIVAVALVGPILGMLILGLLQG